MFQAAVEGLARGSSHMYSEYGPNLSGMEALEYQVWIHSILEIVADKTEEVCTSTYWDNWVNVLSTKQSPTTR